MSRSELIEKLEEALQLAKKLEIEADKFCAAVRAANPDVKFDVDQMNAEIKEKMTRELERIKNG